MNSVLLVGRVSKDPELKETLNGKKVCYFTLVVPNFGKTIDGSKKDPSFISCVVWGKNAENFVKYNKKGSQIAVNGRIVPREYIKATGEKNKYYEVCCDTVSFVRSPQIEENDEIYEMEEETLPDSVF